MNSARRIRQVNMDLQKCNVKFFVEKADGIPLRDFIRIFNTWIQTSDGEYYDLRITATWQAAPAFF